ncbi:MAG: F-type H+-transporting ATPase subunit b [Actinomycetota bacterium]|nr:F-type H+-transporting ATPase subunit b [Actinomycetota bacterium]MDQ1494399.1 F-type H+-transporting ATPase subunit b [Actinomycetota bacterium]MDQ1540689.1 F-type H+-transporting ATPase subunit b [Actinomycetota bacterium]
MPTVIAAAEAAKTNNFLIPNGTFVVELITFLLVLFILGKYVVPIINRALTERQAAIRQQFQDAEDARTRLEASEAEYRELIAKARADAAREREEAREQGARILADLRAEAQVESERIIKAAHQQIEAERARTVTALRAEVGTLAIELAAKVVGESLTDDGRQHRVVERFLAEVESRSGEGLAAEQARG